MTAVSFHHPKSVVLDHGSLYHWLTIHDDRGDKVSVHFDGGAEEAHAFALAVLLAVATPERVVNIMPKEES